MIVVEKIRDLDIAKQQFDFDSDIEESVDYQSWVDYIDNNHKLFVWFEDTEDGKEVLSKIDSFPLKMQQSLLSMLNRVRCFAKFNSKKGHYDLSAACSSESKRVSISFERKPTIEELRLFLDMANYLGAYLLFDRKKIIDAEVIEELEKAL